MNTTHKTAGILAALLFALAVATPTATAATLSRPPQVRTTHFNWYRWHPTARTLERRYGSKVVVGVESMRDLKSLRVEYGFQDVQTIPALHAVEVHVNSAQVQALLTRGTQDPRIRYVSPASSKQHTLNVPNDPYLSEIDAQTNLPYEWPFLATHVDQALQMTQGDPHIVVGVIDTGVAYVPDLAGKIDSLWTVHGTTVTQVFTSNDQVGHGTAVASLIAANDGDGFGMAGFGGATHIIGVSANDKGTFNISDVNAAVALTKLVSLGVRIVNMSFGGPTPSQPPLVDAIHQAAAKGVLLIAAAGNDSRGYVSWPAALLQPSDGGRGFGIVVGATDVNGNRGWFSDFGDHLSLVAPGFGVLVAPPPLSQLDGLIDPSTGLPEVTTWLGTDRTKYGYGSGTSFSAPEVAGVAALVWAARPALTNYQVADILKQSASRQSPGWTPEMGCGILDAGAALRLATSRPASAWAETPNTDSASCSAFGDAPATWPAAEQDQTVTFPAIASRRMGARDFTAKATASSGLPVSFTATGACSMNWDGSKVHLLRVGLCTVTASQLGNTTYNFASASRQFRITKAHHQGHTH
jgi:subtilisin family serine protease